MHHRNDFKENKYMERAKTKFTINTRAAIFSIGYDTQERVSLSLKDAKMVVNVCTL